MEIGQTSLEALNDSEALVLPLERAANGRLTSACKEKLLSRLQSFFRRTPFQPRPRVICALSARGVSLRRLSLPSAGHENLRQLLLLQVEHEFPIPPDELAWGYRPLASGAQGSSSAPTDASSRAAAQQQQFLIAAVKKEAVEEYSDLLAKSGVTPVFTLAALARGNLCSLSAGQYALLDIGVDCSELLCFEDGAPGAIRVLAWGSEDVTRALQERLGVSRDEAEKLWLSPGQAAPNARERDARIRDAADAALNSLAAMLNGHQFGRKIFLTGRTARCQEIVAALGQRLGVAVESVPADSTQAEVRSAAVLGLQRTTSNGAQTPLLVLQVKPTNGGASVARPASWKWVALASALVIGLLVLPYAEALLFKPHLARELAALKAGRGRLAVIDRELGFLQYLKQNQPPCLDTLFLLAKAAPQGAKLDSISMNRRGDLSWRGTMKDSQQVTDFRSKLIASGFFSGVTVDEQTPSPDRQKVTVRMTAQWMPFNVRQALAIGPTPQEIEKAKTAPKELTMGGAGGGAPFPMGAPGMEGAPPPPGRPIGGAPSRPTRTTKIGGPNPPAPPTGQ
jgi:Tfp pilus assembly PilM family ATPase